MLRMSSKTRDSRYQEMLRRLRAARQASGLTQHDASMPLKRYPTYANKVENAERRIDPIELIDLAKFYGQPIEHFLEEKQ